MTNLHISEDNILYEQFDISKYGFLTDPDTISDDLPRGFEQYKNVVNAIENPNGKYFRQLVDNLKCGKTQQYYKNLTKKLSYVQKKQLYSLFTFIAQKYVRCMGKDDTKIEIPYEIGIVWNECAKEFNLPCVTSYGATILYNCVIDENGKFISRHAISGTNDELHFYKVHMQLEAYGANILKDIYFFDSNNKNQLLTILEKTTHSIKNITKIMKTMYDGCDPTIFWTNIRHYLGGFTKDNGLPNGLKVSGTNLVFKYVGGSAAQSTLIQTFDVFLGVPHESEHGTKFLLDQRAYMPQKHQNFLNELQIKYSNDYIKNLVLKFNDEELTSSYDKCIDSLKMFRQAHYNIVHKYIVKFIEKDTWYVTVCNTLFGEYSNITKYVKSFVNKVNKKLNKNNIHGKNGSGGLPTEQLEDYIDDTDNTKILKKYDKPFNIKIKSSVWLCAMFIVYLIIKDYFI